MFGTGVWPSVSPLIPGVGKSDPRIYTVIQSWDRMFTY